MTARPKIRATIGTAIVVLVLALSQSLRDIAHALGLGFPRFPFPWGGSILDNTIALVLVLAAALCLAPRLKKENLGLHWNGWTGPALTLLATLPCWIGLGLQGKIASDLRIVDLLMLALVFPLAEEIIFRGFGFVYTRTVLRWSLPAAAALQAVIFGLIHWINVGAGGGVAVEILCITFFGGLLFAALDALDGYAIWSGWVFHCSVNAAWEVFSVSDNAATGWIGNSLRFASALLALLLLRFILPRLRRPSRERAEA
jgi:membrane protease YdiL (CAAX protease family)